MKDRQLLRFDSIVAVCALLASAIAAGAMVYQTRVMQQQFAATVWPYLSVENDNGSNSIAIKLNNDGAGPALIRSAELIVDGKAVPGWGDVFDLATNGAASRKHQQFAMQAASIDAGTTLRAGDSRTIFAIRTKTPQILKALRAHKVTLRFCYCSINDSCWQMQNTTNTDSPDLPQEVARCEVSSIISAGPILPQ